jgi:O-antigen/teichoic acid export membrane protein
MSIGKNFLAKIYSSLINSVFVRDVGLVSAAQALSGIIALCFTVLAARLLGIVDYGLFQALLALFATLSFFILPLYLGSVHCVGVVAAEDRKKAVGELLLMSGSFCLVLASGVVITSGQLAYHLHSRSVLPIIVMAALLIAKALLTVVYGAFQAQHRYGLFSVSKIVESSLCLVVGLALVWGGGGVAGALLGYVAGAVCLLIYSIMKLDLFEWDWSTRLLRQEFHSLWKLFLALGALMFIGNFPILFARARLDVQLSGYLGALYNLRNVVLPFSYAVSIPFYSRIISSKSEFHLVVKALILVSLLAVGFVSAGLLFSREIIGAIYGQEFLGASGYMAFYGISLWGEMATMIVLFHMVSKRDFSLYALIIPVVITSAALLILRNLSIGVIMTIQIIGWLVFLGSIISNGILKRGKQEESPETV